MARVTAVAGTRKKPKKSLEVKLDDAIRAIIKTKIEIELEGSYEKISEQVQPKIKKELIDFLVANFGIAIETIVECAVVNELEMISDEHDSEEEEEEDGDDSEEEEGGEEEEEED